MPAINLEKLFLGRKNPLLSCSLFKARKCHFLPSEMFDNATCNFLVKL